MKKIEPTKNVTPIAVARLDRPLRGDGRDREARATRARTARPSTSRAGVGATTPVPSPLAGAARRGRAGVPCGARASASAPRCRRARAGPRSSRTARARGPRHAPTPPAPRGRSSRRRDGGDVAPFDFSDPGPHEQSRQVYFALGRGGCLASREQRRSAPAQALPGSVAGSTYVRWASDGPGRRFTLGERDQIGRRLRAPGPGGGRKETRCAGGWRGTGSRCSSRSCCSSPSTA